jgi:dolichol-phosphate mannosyltransferase
VSITSEHITERRPSAPHAAPRTASVVVVLPTYNEIDNLATTVARIRASVPRADILVVDDNSPDGTGAEADRLADAHEGCAVLHRSGKGGLGTAYRAGFALVLRQGYDVVVQMDADGSHDPAQLPRLLGALEYADVALGSRYVAMGQLLNWPKHREWLSRAGNKYSRVMLGVFLSDITGGFRVFRRSALDAVAFDDTTSQGYCFQIEMAWRACARGLRVTEVPITFTEREAGESKMSPSIVAEAVGQVGVWATRRASVKPRSLQLR